MFRKLRNKLIWINLGITTVVIVTAFTAIYLFATQSADNRPPLPEQITSITSDDFFNTINVTIKNERQAAANDLLITLIIAGIAIEIIVVLVSYYLAEEAIKPVREAYESQKVFIANASHEIKTPLAAISANLEAADIHGNKWIKNVEVEAEKLAALNNELLTLARTDLVNEAVAEDVDLKELTSKLLDSFEPRMKGIDLESNISVHGKAKMARADFAQVFGVLMDNAIKYCDKKIILCLNNHELVISNDGAVIKEEDSSKIFERFYQVDKSAEGVGLGLSIAKSLADRNGWDLSAKSEDGLTTFTLKF